MATEAATINGVYDGQYSQPAELAASTPSHAPSASQSSTTATSSQKADPQEIGWYFVEQYYTTLSKSPERIHLFYNKKSQLITGNEAEKVVPAVGVKAINEKIKALDITNCKVRVLNVDSQSSFDNIVIQVIGHMSNKSEPHHKFVQTFILATQPNGYYVLNDIFRYLSDDEDEIIEDEVTEEAALAEESAPVAAEPSVESSVPETVTTESAAEEVDGKLEATKEAEAAPEEAVNGTTEEAEPEVEESEPEKTDAVQDADTTATEKPAEPEHTPAQTPPPQAAASDAPPARKTWASLVGTKAPAIPALPQAAAPAVSTSAAQPKSKAAQPVPAAKAPSDAAGADTNAAATQSNGWQTAESGKKARGQQAKGQEAGNVYAYIKNVNEKIDARVLREVLEKFGEIKYYDVSRPKQCAFVEFATPEGYASAIAANPHTVGTETINIEERRPRPGNFTPNAPQFNRGGGTAAGRGRGGNMQQRTGSQGAGFNREAGRGNFQQRGGKPANAGNNKPRGGTSQAA